MRDTIEIKIEKLIFGGMALARVDGKALFVEGGLPGEIVRAELSGKKGGVDYYNVSDIIGKSEKRRDPNCQYYGICGGCDWLHVDYSEQLKSKEEIFKEQLQRVGKISEFPEIEIFKAKEYGYRIRAQIKVDQTNNSLGFFKKGSNDIVDISNCPLLSNSLNEILKNKENVLLSVDDDTKQIKLLDSGEQIISFPVIDGFTEPNGIKRVDDKEFMISGKNFFQSNQFLLSDMGNWVKKNAEGKTFIDMYGGLGFFSVFVGDRFENGILVESDRKMVKAATKNFKRNSLKNIKALALSSEKFFSSRQAQSADCIIVDPPRPGLTKKVRLALGELLPRQIIYISCNPSTQARDIGFLVNHRDYKIKAAALFDLYPNTHHMETGLILER